MLRCIPHGRGFIRWDLYRRMQSERRGCGMGTKRTNGRRKYIKKLQLEVTKQYYTSLLPMPLSSHLNQREHVREWGPRGTGSHGGPNWPSEYRLWVHLPGYPLKEYYVCDAYVSGIQEQAESSKDRGPLTASNQPVTENTQPNITSPNNK